MIVLAGCWLLPLAACSRTSDGTVVVKKPPAISALLPVKPVLPSWMRRKQTRVEETSVVSQFPPPPARKTAPARKRMKPLVVRPDASAKLACRNQTGAGGRVRVVCQ
jgi:hypothetical protein